MVERYSRFFIKKDNLYTEGAPIIIAAHSLLKDTIDNKLVAQIKIKSISDVVIKAITVKITTSDTADRDLDYSVEFQYLDQNLTRNGEIGTQTPIELDNDFVRNFNVTVTEVVFKDSSVWKCPDKAEWKSLAEPELLTHYFVSRSHLAIKYRNFHSRQDFKYIATRDRDLWICSCGTINHADEETCCNCSHKLTDLENIDIDALEQVKIDFKVDYANDNLSIVDKIKGFIDEHRFPVIAVGFVVAFVLMISFFSAILPSAEEKRAEVIKENFIGQSFTCETTEESDLYKKITTRNIKFESETNVIHEYSDESYSREKKYKSGSYSSYYPYYTPGSYYYTDWEKDSSPYNGYVETLIIVDWSVTVFESGDITLTLDYGGSALCYSVEVNEDYKPIGLYKSEDKLTFHLN